MRPRRPVPGAAKALNRAANRLSSNGHTPQISFRRPDIRRQQTSLILMPSAAAALASGCILDFRRCVRHKFRCKSRTRSVESWQRLPAVTDSAEHRAERRGSRLVAVGWGVTVP